MKVRYASQVVSSSVADAIDWLRDMGAPEFAGSEATTKFLRIIDAVFDFLNSRNPFAKGNKKPIFLGDIPYLETKIKDWILYLTSLTTVNKIPLLVTKRKCFVLGFTATLKSVLAISKELLLTQYYKYILTFKFSQDHLELFFGIVRLRLGCNNNPTALQLKYITKKILLKNSIVISSATNCTLFNDSPGKLNGLFTISSRRRKSQRLHEVDEENDVLQNVLELDGNVFYK